MYVKPTGGPSNGHHEEKEEQKKPEEKEATSSEGNYNETCQLDELMCCNFLGKISV